MKHICIVTSVHPWDDVRVASRIAATFVDAGYRVTWVGPDRTISNNRDVKQPGVAYHLFRDGRGRLGRLLGARRAVRIARQVVDVDWWYAPDPDVAGKLPSLASVSNSRSMFDVHESYHGGLLNRWFPGNPPAIVREALRRHIARNCSKIDLVIGVSSGVLEPYCKGHSNSVVVRNLAPDFFNSERHIPEKTGPERVRFLHGKISAGNGTLQVASAISLLSDDVQREITVTMLDVAGTPESTKKNVLADAASSSHRTLVVLPGVSHEQMVGLMTSCSVGLIAYQRDLGHDSLPNRLFEYMAAGLAILAPCYSPEIVRILEEEEIGITADFEVPAEIATAITWLVEHPDEVAAMGERAGRAYRERYSWGREAERMVAAMVGLE